MAIFLLVHGAWHGGWCWRRVTPLLRNAGHEVFVPTLTGLGERAHLANPSINVTSHAQDILGVLKYEDLKDVILVGHSYAGMVITAVAEREAQRLKHLVYLDAFVPQDGESLSSFIPAEFMEPIKTKTELEGDGWRMSPLPMEAFGVFEPADVEWVGANLTPHPFKTQTETLHLSSEVAAKLPRTYIYCSNPPMGFFERFATRAQHEGWNYHELRTGHDAMVTAPQEVANILLELA